MHRVIPSIIFTFSAASSAAPISYVCDYGSYSDKEGNHNVKEPFVLTFVVDAENNKGYIVGNQGTDEVAVIPQGVGGGVAFIEITGFGNVMTTAIDAAGNSVHSRNTSLGGELVPSQYYGTCEVRK